MADLGLDLSCVTDLEEDMAEVSGRTCLAQAIARRLTTPRGGLIDDPGYGYDLRDLLNADVGPRELAAAASAAENECLKDERVLSATVSIVYAQQTVDVALEDADGPFKLVLAVDTVTVAILQAA